MHKDKVKLTLLQTSEIRISLHKDQIVANDNNGAADEQTLMALLTDE